MRTILFAALAISATMTFAQDEVLTDYSMDLQWGPLTEIDDSESNFLLGANTEHYFIHSTIDGGWLSSGHPMYSKFDIETNEVIWSLELEETPEYKGEDTKLSKVYMHNDGLAIIYYLYHRRDDQHYLLRQDVSPEGEMSELIVLAALPSDDDDDGFMSISGYTSGLAAEGKDETPAAERYTKYLVYSSPQFEDKEDNRVAYYDLLDSNYYNVFHKELEFPYSWEASRVVSSSISDDDKIFILFRKDIDEERGEVELDDDPNRQYLLYMFNPYNDSISEFNLGLGEVFVNDIRLQTNYRKDLLMIAGTYSKEEYGATGGSFFITMNKSNGEIVTAAFQEFGTETKLHFMDMDDVEDGDEIERPFIFREVIPREDGGAVLVFEEYQMIQHTVRDANTGAMSTYYTYRYGNMLIVNIEPDATLKWVTVIDKLYHEGYTGHGGYLSMVHEDRLHIVYNDDEDNIEFWMGEEDDVDAVNLRKGNIAMITMDLEGNVVYEVIGECRDDDKLIFAPRFATPVQGTNGEKTLWFRFSGEEFRVGTFEFNSALEQ